MHTKEELLDKKSKSEQLDLTKTLSDADKIARKRRYLYFSIIATIGLSLLFWIFHSFQNYFKNPEPIFPKISLENPLKYKANPSISLNDNLEFQINQILGSDAGHWSVSASVDGNLYNWSKNNKIVSVSDAEIMINKLIVQKKSDSKITSYIPKSIEVKENFIQKDISFSLESLILIPNHKILLVLNYNGTQPFPPPHFPEIISSMYWMIVQSFAI